MSDEMAATDRLGDLSRSEHLLVWALRAIAIGREDCPMLEQTFGKVFGDRGGQALTGYMVIVKTIGMAGRRRLRVHVPGCPCVSPDEKAIVGVIAAAQASLADGDETLLRMRIQFLVERRPAESLVFAAQMVARILLAGGCRLSVGPADPPQGAGAPRVVH